MTRDASTCVDCEKCTMVCPARLPVHTMHRVSSVECTSCQDCVAVCPVRGCLTVQAPAFATRVPRLRPTVVVALAAGVYAFILLAFVLAGRWHGSVSESEYAARLREIDSPLYTHVGGLAASEATGSAPASWKSHARP